MSTYSILYSAVLSRTASSGLAGDVLIPSTIDGAYVKATAANRGTRRATGIALSPYVAGGVVDIAQTGQIGTNITGFTAASASWVRTSSTGTLEKVTPAAGDDLLGKVDTDGRFFLDPGKWDSTNYAGSGGGSSTTVSVTSSYDLDGNTDPTYNVCDLHALMSGVDGAFAAEIDVVVCKLVGGVVAPTVGGAMRLVGSWVCNAGTDTVIIQHPPWGQSGGAYSLTDDAGVIADIDVDLSILAGRVYVRLTPSVDGTYRYVTTVRVLQAGSMSDDGGEGDPPVAAVNFAGLQSYYNGSASGAVSTARVRFRLDTMPDSTLRIVAGTNNGAGNSGWLVVTADNVGGAVNGQLIVYAAISSALTEVCRKFFVPADIGRVFTLHIVCDDTFVWVYLDGKKLSVGTACAAITAATSGMNIGGRSDGTFSSDCTIIDVAEGNAVLTRDDVATDAASPTPAFASQTHRYVASPTTGASWFDAGPGALDLTRVGSPVIDSFSPVYGRHCGTIEIWGDSIAAGANEGLTYGDGWRREFQQQMSSSYRRAVTIRGKNPAATPTYDYDYFHTATGGEALVTRLATMVADLNVWAPADSATLLAYGINDIVAQARTSAQLVADVTTAVGYVNTARPGRPIFVCNMLPYASLTAPQQVEWDAYQGGFAAMITTLQATHPNVVAIDYEGVVTNPADTDQLFDGVHPTVVTYAAMATVIASIVSEAMAAADSVFDPATLSLTGWWRADYTASPWTGTASAGSSGSRNLTEGTNPPGTGATLNGHTPADFDGTNDQLTSANTISQLLGTSGWSYSALVDLDSVFVSARYLFCTSGAYVDIRVYENGIILTQYTTGGAASASAEVATTITTGAHLIQARWTGSVLQLRLDGGIWATSPAIADLGGTTDTFLFCARYDSAAGNFLDARIYDQLFADSSLSDEQFDALRDYVNSRYDLSL